MAASWDDYLNMLDGDTAQQVAQFYNRPAGYVDPYRYSHLGAEDMPGDKLYADLIRAQLQDYLTRFQPVEDFLAGQITATGTAQLGADLERTRGAVLGAGENIYGQQQRSMERYGLSGSPQSTASKNATVGTLIGDLNLTRQRDADRRNALLVGGLGDLGAKARSTG